MAELSDAEKDAISHRGRAVRALLAWLPTDLAPIRHTMTRRAQAARGGAVDRLQRRR